MTPNMANRVAERLAMSGRSDGIPQTQCLNLRFSEFRAVVGMVRAVLRPIRGYVRNIDSTRYIADPANGDRCLVLGWSGDIAQARRRASEAGQDGDDRLSSRRAERRWPNGSLAQGQNQRHAAAGNIPLTNPCGTPSAVA
jgi:hypothetical protein